jgi:uncharacterized protein with von Willebrand factor type A (vWA) domain
MSALPFNDFLDLLRAKGLGVGLHEYLAVGKLLNRWDSTDREELRDAIAALVARHEGEVQEIRDLFDQFYPPPVEPKEEAESRLTAPPGREYRAIGVLRDRRAWWAAVACLSAALALAVAYRYYSAPNVPPLPAAPLLEAGGPRPPLPPVQDPASDPAVPTALIQEPPEVGADLPSPPSRINRPLLASLSVSTLVVTLMALWGRRIRAAARQWTIDAWQTAIASLSGPYHAPLVLRDLVTRLPRRDIEDAATLLARAFSGVGRSKELNVPRSLKETLRAGMRPQLVFKLRRVQQTILVLQDVSQMMNAHAARVESLLVDLRRQGVALERWCFDADISTVMPRKNGPPLPLEALARRREDWPLLIISSGFGVAATMTLPDRTWMRAFRTWTRRVWLSPIRDPELWPLAVRQLPISVLPMTRPGLLQAATILAQGEYANAGMLYRAIETAAPVTIAEVEKLKQLASVVPYPTIGELELLRQRFAPEVPERAVLHVANDIDAHEGAPIRMNDGDIREHLQQLRREARPLEIEVRRYLLKVLADSEPVAGSAAHLRWEISRAIHQVEIAELTAGDVNRALAVIEGLGKSPLWRELRKAVDRLPDSSRLPDIKQATGMKRRTNEPPTFQDETGQLKVKRFRWRMPRWQDAASAAAVALVFAAIGSSIGAFRVQASHALDAYTLEYRRSPTSGEAGELHLSARDPGAPVPRTVQLYRDSQPIGGAIELDAELGATVPISADAVPHVYQGRAQLPNGAFALSNTVWAPVVLVIIDARPWARVTVRSTDGRVPELAQTTPAALRLPEGTYDLSFENGGITPPLTEQIRVSANGQKVFSFAMPQFDPNQLLNQMGIPSAAPPAAP